LKDCAPVIGGDRGVARHTPRRMDVPFMSEQSGEPHAIQRALELPGAAADGAGHVVIGRPFPTRRVVGDGGSAEEELPRQFRVTGYGKEIGVEKWERAGGALWSFVQPVRACDRPRRSPRRAYPLPES